MDALLDDRTLRWYRSASLLKYLTYRSMLDENRFSARAESLFDLSVSALG